MSATLSMLIATLVTGRIVGLALPLVLLLIPATALAHPRPGTSSASARHFVSTLAPALRKQASRPFDDPERTAHTWLPGRRTGIALADLGTNQTAALRELLHHMLTHTGNDRIDAILATEAALGVIEGSRGYRDPKKYYTAVFGTPAASGRWALRFEGHHLSVNLTFEGDTIIAATPLFLGANPETIPAGPDKGLRALGKQVDLARRAFNALTAEQQSVAKGGKEWFAGFLSTPGSRRAKLGEPGGLKVGDASEAAQGAIKELIADFVATITERYAGPYLDWVGTEEWPHLRFYWSGEASPGGTYYWRLQGRRMLIEHDGQSGGTHIHSIWRDAEKDFGGR